MGISERKERDRESMKSLIMNAAMELYLEEGFEKVTIRSIAEKIEFSPATIYLYFRDKDEIFYALYNLSFGLFVADQARYSGISDPHERLYQRAKAYVKWAMDNPKLYDLMFIIEIPMNVIAEEHCEDIGKLAYQQLKETVAECIDSGTLKIKNAELASMMVWNMLHGVSSLIIKKRIIIPNEEVEQMTKAIVESFFLLISR